MKKIAAIILCLCMVSVSLAALAGEADSFFEQFYGMEWSFSSGAGGWSTDLRILPDGSFSGEYHDSEMGECADAYPDGTVYTCSFAGRFGEAEAVDEYTYAVRVQSLSLDGTPGDESIDSGIRYVITEPYGVSEGDRMLLYMPGTPLDMLTEDMVFWTHAHEMEEPLDTLPNWFLASEKNQSGFLAMDPPETVSLPNPWKTVTAEELLAASDLAFGVPEGAENVLLRYMESEELAEMQFTLYGDEFCARVQPAELQEGELMNISGMYFGWETVESVEVLGMKGMIGTAKTGSVDWVQLCLWYDASASLMHSLSVSTTDPDGLDLAAVAEACLP